MMRAFFFIYLLIMCSFYGIVYAQAETENALSNINKIKREPDSYFYAEATSQTWDEALENAKTLLSAQLESWAKQEHEPIDGYIAKANEHIFQIKAMRGQLYRAFVYVKRSDLLSFSSDQEIMIVPVNSVAHPTIELVHKGSVLDDSRNEVIERANKDESILEIKSNLLGKQGYILNEHETQMIEVASFSEVRDYIVNLQSANKVQKYGKFADMPDDIDCYLFIYDKQGSIPAYLHKTKEGYFNLKTKNFDSIDNYKGCGAFWYKLIE